MLQKVAWASRWLAVIGMSSLVGLMFLVTGEVFLRGAFNSPIKGSVELSEHCLVLAVFLSASFTEFRGRHVRAGFLASFVPPRALRIIEIVTNILSLLYLSIIVWRTPVTAWEYWKFHEVTPTLYLPVAAFQMIVAIGIFALWLVMLLKTIELVGKPGVSPSLSEVSDAH